MYICILGGPHVAYSFAREKAEQQKWATHKTGRRSRRNHPRIQLPFGKQNVLKMRASLCFARLTCVSSRIVWSSAVWSAFALVQRLAQVMQPFFLGTGVNTCDFERGSLHVLFCPLNSGRREDVSQATRSRRLVGAQHYRTRRRGQRLQLFRVSTIMPSVVCGQAMVVTDISLCHSFFLAYQGAKTIMEVQRGQDDLVNVAVATAVAGLPFVRSTVMRQNIPYALMLIALDHFHEEINSARK